MKESEDPPVKNTSFYKQGNKAIDTVSAQGQTGSVGADPKQG